MIKLVRVDHRLLHGQVIFSWTKQVGTNYIAKELPEVTEINYGGVAKKAGSKEYGKAVYLNEAELKATQELISMGKKIYIQMVPSSPIEHASFEN